MYLHRVSLFRSGFLATTLGVLLQVGPAAAMGCCSASELDSPGEVRASAARIGATSAYAASAWRASAAWGAPRRPAGNQRFDYVAARHVWLMGGVRTVATGLPLTAKTSNADRTAFSQAGLGLGYLVSPTLRAITNWNTGLGAASVSRGSQFTVGVALHY